MMLLASGICFPVDVIQHLHEAKYYPDLGFKHSLETNSNLG